jgi:hypothetical protein
MRATWLGMLLAAALSAVSPAAARAVSADDLVGAWHVLVHYQDSQAGNPEAKRWEDRIWVFEKQGEQLRWTDYPIVVFADEEGRFERLGTNRQSRVLDYWEPNPAQLAQIEAGLAINSRGSRSKTLRGSDAKGWSSAARGGGYQSARIITYEETWTIDGLPDAPRFVRQDSMGSAGSEELEGRTLYETTGVEAGGKLLRGKFDRDGTRSGSFRLMRTGAVHSVSEGGEKAAGGFDALGRKAMGKQLKRAELVAMLSPGLVKLPGERSEAEWREAVAGPDAKQERLALRAALEEGLRTQVLSEEDIRTHNVLLSNLAVELERLFVEEGKSLADLRKMMVEGEVLPGGVGF